MNHKECRLVVEQLMNFNLALEYSAGHVIQGKPQRVKAFR
jgi:hypothetical protein